MADNPEQRRLQSLLRFAASAGSHGNPSDAPVSSSNAEDRAWLNEAIRDYSNNAIDPVQYMKEQLTIIHRFLHPKEVEDSKISATNAYDALEEISDNCDNYDMAKDLHKIGGFDIMIQCMKYSDPELQWRACVVLAEATQNHEYCQNALIEMKGLPVILSLLEMTGSSDKVDMVTVKAFYALSCLVRGNDNALRHFEENDGFTVLVKVMQSENAQLKMKSIFFCQSLCDGDPKYSKILHERGIEIQVISMLKNINLQASPEHSTIEVDLMEKLLMYAMTLVSTSQDAKKEFCSSSYEFGQVLRDLKSWISKMEDGKEYLMLCDQLLESCFGCEDDADDR